MCLNSYNNAPTKDSVALGKLKNKTKLLSWKVNHWIFANIHWHEIFMKFPDSKVWDNLSVNYFKFPGEKENVITDMVLWFLFNLVHRFLY